MNSRCYVIPLFGAYLADTRWGRFKTVCISVAVALFGHVLLIISSVPGVIENTNGSLACFIIAIIIMGLGTGGFKANISPLIAEQYKRTRLFIGRTRSGERVIVDPIMTTSRIYMYFYLFINVGSLIGQISMAYSEKVRCFIYVDTEAESNCVFPVLVRRFLACVHAPHHRLPHLPTRPLLRPQHVHALASPGLCPFQVPLDLASGHEGPLDLEPR